MEFKKWSSIENHYQKPIFEKWLNLNPDLNETKVEVTEKIHGANFSILSSPGTTGVKFACRNSILKDDAKFNDFQNVFKRIEYIELIDFIDILSDEIKANVQIYGEYYGGGIQKGVFYGEEKNFKWYSLRLNGVVVPPIEADKILQVFQHLKVPVIGVFNIGGSLLSFIENFDTKFKSNLTPKSYEGENICEGVVIRPYDKNFYSQLSLLIIKKKNDEFKDKAHKPKRIKKDKTVPKNIQEASNEAILYINENRTNDLFSKIGRMETMKDASKYAKEYFEDLFFDFEKDNYTMWHDLEKQEQSAVKKKLGSLIFKELKESLSR